MSTNFTPQMQVNSQHQMWSQWTFVVRADLKRPSFKECKENFRRWVKIGFKSTVRRGRIELLPGWRYKFVVQIEGPPAHDPEYREEVRRQFAEHFVARGFGSGAVLEQFEAAVLAGNKEDGTPPDQMIVLPLLDLKSLLAKG